MSKVTRSSVYAAIDTERRYQDKLPRSRTDGGDKTVGDYVTMLGYYHDQLVAEWTMNPGTDAALEVMRKCAAIAVRCMEEHGAPVRREPVYKSPESVWFEPSGKWWHTDETWCERYGPFDTEDAARAALNDYCIDMEREEKAQADDHVPGTAGFKDADKLEWLDVSDEVCREYVYPDGTRYRVEWPDKLNVKKKLGGDSHRIKTKDPHTGFTKSVYVAAGWIAIEWRSRRGRTPSLSRTGGCPHQPDCRLTNNLVRGRV